MIPIDWNPIILTVISTLIGPVLLVLIPMMVTKFFEMNSAKMTLAKQVYEAHKELAAAVVLEVEKVYGNLIGSEKIQIAIEKLRATIGDIGTDALKSLLEVALVTLQKEFGKNWDAIPAPTTTPVTVPVTVELKVIATTPEVPVETPVNYPIPTNARQDAADLDPPTAP